MHYLKPPLLHRDLKVENILISKSAAGTPIYKLCDFGSTAPPRQAAKTAEEGRLIEEDVQKHTTMQYRSPEMIDVWRKQPIDEKADIWALGVLLYKLCYYTTPFEAVGQMAILNASFKFPPHPQFSDRIKKLISWMLKEDPKNRPNIYQVLKETCSMRGAPVPVQDIYTNQAQSEARRIETLPPADTASTAAVGLQKVAPEKVVQQLPDIIPMRRGRPTAPAQQGPVAAKPAGKSQAAPVGGDPFAALDSKNYDVRAGAADELAKRFPSLDEFAIAHDGSKYAFAPTSPPVATSTTQMTSPLNERVTNALADRVFSGNSSEQPASARPQASPSAASSSTKRRASPVRTQTPLATTRITPTVQHPMPIRNVSPYKSTAVGTSPPPGTSTKLPDVNKRPIWRVPERNRTSSQPPTSGDAQATASSLKPSLAPAHRPALLEVHRSKSQTATVQAEHAQSSRPSLEGHRPSAQDLGQANDISRTKSLSNRSRPSSMYVSSNMDFLKDQEQQRKRPSLEIRRHSRQPSQTRESEAEEGNIEDDMDYLRNTEHGDATRRSSKGHHKKRSSLGQIGSNAKSVFSGRFGDAFKRFESNEKQGPMTPEARELEEEPMLLSPITGSEATPSRHSEHEEEDELPADVKREIERRKLIEEENRVAAAAEEYRHRVATQGTGNLAPSRASTIQKRVQSLLDDGRRSPALRRTAKGYGRYTEQDSVPQRPVPAPAQVPLYSGFKPPIISQKPTAANSQSSNNPYPKTRSPATSLPPTPASAPAEQAPLQRVVSRPSAPPKPKALRTGGSAQWPPQQSPDLEKPLPAEPSGLAALLAKDLEGVPDYPQGSSSDAQRQKQPRNDLIQLSPTSPDDLDSFSKRYPSLSGIEMVETEIGGERKVMRVREV